MTTLAQIALWLANTLHTLATALGKWGWVTLAQVASEEILVGEVNRYLDKAKKVTPLALQKTDRSRN